MNLNEFQQMKIITLMLILATLVGCNSLTTKPTPRNQSHGGFDVTTNDTGISPNAIPAFPIPQQAITTCLQGRIDEIITGNEATTIWYKLVTTAGLNSVRLPHTFPLKIKVVENGFCYDYFDVTFRSTNNEQ